MTHPTPLIAAAAARDALAAEPGRWLVFDCQFDLADPSAGERAYVAGHLPGAVYLHLDRDLSAPKTPGSGRHPLPSREAAAARLAALGLRHDLPVLAYDASGGMYGARLWWMLRWLGHEAVWLLDGGLSAWRAAGGRLETGAPAARAPGDFTPRPPRASTIDYATLRASLGTPGRLVVDARAPDRFRGENETLDPVAGHIPGALNRWFKDNLGPDGRFKPAGQLRAEWLALMAGRQPVQLVQQCGSGVTACHNLLAMAQAGLDGASLYPGSWSEWCHQPDAVVATGA
jgi:thiosulfate/3-mercaptopyruvate sulfurtransferase